MNAVFIHIPKTGGITIERTLQLESLRYPHHVKNRFKNGGMVSFGHLRYDNLIKKGRVSEEFHNSSYKFCFCRNPYDRAVSHWTYTKYKHPDRLDPGTSFLDFTRKLTKNGDFRCQSWWLKGVEPDFVGRFESLEQDLKRVADILGRQIKNGIQQANASLHAPYRQCYCEESKERIEKFYQPDFERFDYEHDDTILH